MYQDFENITKQKDELTIVIESSLKNDKLLSKESQKEITDIINSIKSNNEEKIFYLTDLKLIIEPLQDGKVTPQELCEIQKQLKIEGITETYDKNKNDSCGNFLDQTSNAINTQLEESKQKIDQLNSEIDNVIKTIDTTSSDSNEDNINNLIIS